MNRIIMLTFSMLLCYSGISQNRGTLLKESFDNPGLPSGWTKSGLGINNWTVDGTNNAGGEPYELHLAYSPTFNGKSRVISPVINTTGYTELIVEFIHYLNNYSGGHTLGIETTSDGGVTWNQGWSAVYSSTATRRVAESISTPDIGSANFQFCLFYQGNSYNINDWYFDNFELYSLENMDAAITAINNARYIASGSYKADFSFSNRGTTIINSIEAEYQFGDLLPVVETFTSLNMESLASKTLSFTSETFLLPGIYTLKVNILKVNGVIDEYDPNNYMEKTINTGITPGQRRVGIEHFTSSTCPPCVSVNNQMKALLQNNPDKFGITKYQMNWPGIGDPYYTAEGGVRKTYYNVSGVPDVYFNGKSVSVNQTAFNNALNEVALMDISGTFDISGTNITVNFDIASYLEIPEARVYAIVNEKHTTGNALPPPNGNGETEFFHVMMKMLPNGQGTTTSFNEGEVKPFTFTQDLSGTKVEEMSDLEVHVFVQNHATKYVYNSNFLTEYTNTQLNPPRNLVLQDNGNKTVTVTWNVPETGAPTGYNIYLNNELIQSNHNSTSYTATVSTGYHAFKVNAVYSVGISVPAVDFIVICSDEPPTELNAVQSDKDVILTWTAPEEGSDSYIVYYDGDVLQSGVTATTYTHENAPAGEHTYGISSVINGCEESDLIETTITVTFCSAVPESFDAVQKGADVILTWVEPEDGVDYYNVYLDEMLHEENITETTFTIVKPSLGQHVFGITSVTDDCESTMITITLEIVACSPQPESFDAVQEGNNIVLTWATPGNEVDSYNVYLDGTLHQDNITETTYTFVDATEGKHVYGVSSITGDCESEIVEKELTTTDILEQEAAYKIYPNPAEDYVKIEGNHIQRVLLYNVLGQIVETVIVNDNNCRIAASKLSSGIYFIRIYSFDNKVYTRKIAVK